MGLDMYLSASKYIRGYSFRDGREQKMYQDILAATDMTDIASKNSMGMDVEVTVAYWRKANHIHNWFVQNVQDGVDACQRSYVSAEQLQELVDVCKEVLAEPDKAEDLLPVTRGFFFGAGDYGEWYFADLRETIAQLEPLLTVDGVDFYYQASW